MPLIISSSVHSKVSRCASRRREQRVHAVAVDHRAGVAQPERVQEQRAALARLEPGRLGPHSVPPLLVELVDVVLGQALLLHAARRHVHAPAFADADRRRRYP